MCIDRMFNIYFESRQIKTVQSGKKYWGVLVASTPHLSNMGIENVFFQYYVNLKDIFV